MWSDIFTIEATEVNGWVVVQCRGEIDLATNAELRSTLSQYTALGDTRLVVDLSSVDFLDVTGIGILIRAVHMIRRQGGHMKLVITNPAILHTLDLMGLRAHFLIFHSIEEATST